MSGNFEKTSIGWQFQLLQQRVSEWFERLFRQSGNDRLPVEPWAPPEWFFKAFFWLMVLLVGGWILWQLYHLLSPYLGRQGLLWQGPKPMRVADVPGEQLTVAEWLTRSRTYGQQGNYREACRALYMAALQRLADQGILPNEPSRTDGEYLNALQIMPNIQPYQILFRTHERLCFSQTDITKAAFQQCDQAYRETDTP